MHDALQGSFDHGPRYGCRREDRMRRPPERGSSFLEGKADIVREQPLLSPSFEEAYARFCLRMEGWGRTFPDVSLTWAYRLQIDVAVRYGPPSSPKYSRGTTRGPVEKETVIRGEPTPSRSGSMLDLQVSYQRASQVR